MTHFVDCTVTEEARPEVDRIADLIWNGNKSEAREMAKDMGWEQIGSGMGRIVFRVPLDQQEGDRTRITHEVPCVIKFAQQASRVHLDGFHQNREEVGQYESFPPEISEADPPMIVPVSDYDARDYLWVSMPEADRGGRPGEVDDRLKERGWDCSDDLHPDNVGSMHGVAVVLDLGVTCREASPATEDAEEIAEELRSLNARDVTVDEGRQHASVEFHHPKWILPNPGAADPASSISVDQIQGPRWVRLYFGDWPHEKESMLQEAAERISDDLHDEWFGLQIRPLVGQDSDGVEIELDIDIDTHHPDEAWLPDMVVNMYEDVLEGVEEYVADVGDPSAVASGIASELRRMNVRDVSYEVHGLSSTVRFFPPSNFMGYESPSEASYVRTDRSEATYIYVRLGPWRADEPETELLPIGADALIEDFPATDVNIEWERLDVDAGPEIGISIDPIGDDTGFEPDRAVTFVTAVLAAAQRHLPRARREGEPVQGEIEDFIESAIAGTLTENARRVAAHQVEHDVATGSIQANDAYVQMARKYAEELWHHEVDSASINMSVNDVVADIAADAFDAPAGFEITTVPKDRRVVLRVDGDRKREWGFHVGIQAAARQAPTDDKAEFLDQITETVLGSAGEVLRESANVAEETE